ncbi:EXS-domain-containing protein [Peniophora sp. CONT]|nr:EXS-domain-containing protein [Peniophora sp. CONT]
MARLVKTGWTKVRFPDFWLSAQLASLSFTLGNVYFVACSYSVGFDKDPMEVCSHPSAWGVPVLFATLPLLVRFVQCIRRYRDSRHLTRHLVNAGKYAMGIVYYAMYYWWRFDGARYGMSFVLFCISGILYAAGSTAWEYIIDWSAFKRHARYPFLRNNVLYPLPVYYFALVSNAAIRFAWIMYIPTGGPSFALRTWIVAMAEIFRRWQWNFFRMECEHIGNMDQYRITNTELPLFYAPDETGHRTT